MLAGVGQERIHINILDGNVQGGVAILAAAALSLTDADPVGGFVAGSLEAITFHECFQEVKRVSVFGLPIGSYASGDPREKIEGQVRDIDPGQDEIAIVVGDPGQALSAGQREPSNPLVAGRDFPGRRTEEHAGQIAARLILNTIGDIFPDRAPVSQVMVTGQESGEDVHLGIAAGQRRDGEGQVRAQGAFDHQGVGGKIEKFRGVERSAFGRQATACRQHQESTLMQLKHQGARRHVFELAAGATPIPGLCQQTRQVFPAGGRVEFDQRSDFVKMGLRQKPALQNLRLEHADKVQKRERGSPVKSLRGFLHGT